MGMNESTTGLITSDEYANHERTKRLVDQANDNIRQSRLCIEANQKKLEEYRKNCKHSIKVRNEIGDQVLCAACGKDV